MLAPNFERTWVVGLLCVVGTKKWEDLDCGIVCVDTKKWEELGCGFVWLALHFERICVVCLCVNTKLRRFGLWVCCVLLALKFEKTWIVGLCVWTLKNEKSWVVGLCGWHYILRGFMWWVCVWTLNWEHLGCGLLCVVGTKVWEDMERVGWQKGLTSLKEKTGSSRRSCSCLCVLLCSVCVLLCRQIGEHHSSDLNRPSSSFSGGEILGLVLIIKNLIIPHKKNTKKTKGKKRPNLIDITPCWSVRDSQFENSEAKLHTHMHHKRMWVFSHTKKSHDWSQHMCEINIVCGFIHYKCTQLCAVYYCGI